MYRRHEQFLKHALPIAAAIGGVAVGSFVRGRKIRQNQHLAGSLVAAANQRAERAEAARAEAEERADAAQEKSRKDPLTGLFNLNGLDERYSELMDRPGSDKTKLGLLVLDLDEFKRINDTGGHEAGNVALRYVADVIRENSRPGDTPVRLGGDEMALLVLRADEAGTLSAAERIQGSLNANGRVRASFGVAEVNPDISLADNVAIADAALYEAKRQGRDQIVSASSLIAAHNRIH